MNYDPSLLGRKYRLQQEIEERQREISLIDAQLPQDEQLSSFYLAGLRQQQKEQKAKEAAEEFQRQQEILRWQQQQKEQKAKEAAEEFQRQQEILRWQQQQMRERINPFQTPPSTDSTWRI